MSHPKNIWMSLFFLFLQSCDCTITYNASNIWLASLEFVVYFWFCLGAISREWHPNIFLGCGRTPCQGADPECEDFREEGYPLYCPLAGGVPSHPQHFQILHLPFLQFFAYANRPCSSRGLYSKSIPAGPTRHIQASSLWRPAGLLCSSSRCTPKRSTSSLCRPMDV